LGADSDRLDALGRAVHDAMIDVIDIPQDDLFHVLTGHDGTGSALRYGSDYLGVHRDDGIVFVAITFRSGRPQAQKQALYRRITELAQKYAGTEPRNVVITLTEKESVEWSFGQDIAKY